MNAHIFRCVGAAGSAALCFALAAVVAQPQPDPLSPPANGPRKADPAWHALTNATVHPRPGVTLEHATVVIKGDRVVSVEAAPAPASDGGATGAPAAISPRGGIFRGTAAVVSLGKPEEDLSLARPPVYAENTYQSVALDAGRMGGRRGGGMPPAEMNTNSNWPAYPDSQMGAIAL